MYALIATCAILAATAAVIAVQWLRRDVLVAVDVSPSMLTGDLLARVKDRVRPGLRRRVTWVAFSQWVELFELEEGLPHHMAGTNFHALKSWIDTVPEAGAFDQIVVVTDTHAASISPAEPEKWTWLVPAGITPANWVDATGMDVETLPAATAA